MALRKKVFDLTKERGQAHLPHRELIKVETVIAL